MTNDYIIFIELKKSRGERKGIIQQLKGAQCVVDYFRAIAKVFWHQDDFLNTQLYKHRFVSIHHINVNQRPTFDQPSNGIHDQAEYMLKIAAPNRLEFKRLIGMRKR
ncbi:MAG: hypothetical protein R8K21_02800 [Mariprofundales bacterium]